MAASRIVPLVFGLLLVGPVWAQAPDGDPPPIEDVLAELEAQRRRLEQLEGEVRRLRDQPPEAKAEAPSEPPIRLGLFWLETSDKAFRLDMKARLIAEYRFSDHGHDDFDNSFEARQVRLNFKGRLYDRVTFQIALEFGGGARDPLRQGWGNLRVFDWLQLKAGQDKLPLSFTFQEPFKYMNHPEWPVLVGNDNQFFELGAQLWGWLFDKKLKYVLAAFNGNGANTRGDEDDDSDLVARVEFIPFDYLNLHVAGAYTPSNTDSTGPRDLRTFGNNYTRFVTFDPANRRRSYLERYTTGMALRLGPLEVLAEFLYARHHDVRSPTTNRDANLSVWSYYVEALYILTGESKKTTIEEVASPLYTRDQGFGTGAWGVALRYEEIQVDDEAFSRGYATGTDETRSVAATLSWWPFEGMRYSLTYNYSAFRERVTDSTGRRHSDDHIVVARMWLTF